MDTETKERLVAELAISREYALRMAREIVDALETDALGTLAKPTWGRLGNLNALVSALRDCKHFAKPRIK